MFLIQELHGWTHETAIVTYLQRQPSLCRDLGFTVVRITLAGVNNTESETPLTGRHALVTGASRGIGRATALALAQAGADVAVNYQTSEEAAAETCAAIEADGQRAVAVQADVSEPAATVALVEQARAELGRIDVLVNNAGIARPRAVGDVTRQDWQDHVETNLTAAFETIRSVLPGMRDRGWGRIVNVSSVDAQNGGIVGPHYAASKAGLLGLTRSYARELADEGVTVDAVAPALVDTDAVDDQEVSSQAVPVGRFGRPAEVASVVCALVVNGYVTGQTVGVDGGVGLG